MKHFVGIFWGFWAGFLAYMSTAMIFMDMKDSKNTSFVPLILFVFTWAATYFFAIRNTSGFTKPMSRVSLVGGGLWLAMGLAGIIYSGKAVAATEVANNAQRAGAALGGGLMTMLTGGISIFMAVTCLISFFIFWNLSNASKEAKTAERKIKRCPSCAEDVYAEAVVCKNCKHAFSDSQVA